MASNLSGVLWLGDKLEAEVRKASVTGLTRAAAYIRGVARRQIRRRKNKTSAPGQPPYEHGTFRNSIGFAVARRNLTAYIGPRRLMKPADATGPAPKVLEFGGVANVPNIGWFAKKAPPMTSTGEVAAWVRAQGYGPIYAGRSSADVARQAGTRNTDHIRRSRNRLTKKTVYYLRVRIKSSRQAERAAGVIVQYWGYPVLTRARIAARPYMGPSLAAASPRISTFFINILR